MRLLEHILFVWLGIRLADGFSAPKGYGYFTTTLRVTLLPAVVTVMM